MNWIVIEHLNGNRLTCVGPFPTQDQAMTYAEQRREGVKTNWNGPAYEFAVTQLLRPERMPEPIHG